MNRTRHLCSVMAASVAGVDRCRVANPHPPLMGMARQPLDDPEVSAVHVAAVLDVPFAAVVGWCGGLQRRYLGAESVQFRARTPASGAMTFDLAVSGCCPARSVAVVAGLFGDLA